LLRVNFDDKNKVFDANMQAVQGSKFKVQSLMIYRTITLYA